MRVVHVVGFCQPKLGYEEFYLPLYQRKAGIDAMVVTSDRPSREAGAFSSLDETRRARFPSGWDSSDQSDVPILRLALVASLYGQTMLRGLSSALRTLKPDVVHCHDVTSPLALQVAVASMRQRFPVVYDSHALYDAFKIKGLTKHTYLAIHRIFIRGMVQKTARVVIALSGETEQILTSELGFPRRLIARSTLGVDTTLFRPDHLLRQSARTSMGLQDNVFLIVYTGKITTRKNIRVLIEAFARLGQSRPDCRLLLVGSADRNYKRSLEILAAENGISNQITWVEPVPQDKLRAYYNAADVCVWPGQSSLAMLEAVACGTPIVVHNRPANLERISRRNGIAFDGTADGLASVLIRLFDNPAERRGMAERCRRFASDELDWRKIAASTLEIYRRAEGAS